MAGSLIGKSVLVTGSTSGIGWGIINQFAKTGARVMLHGLEKENEVSDLLSKLKSVAHPETKVDFTHADLMTESGCENLVRETTEKFQKLDVIVNNAGVQYTARTEDFPSDKWDFLMKVNLYAPFYLSKAALPQMYKRGWGRLIHISSAQGLRSSVKKSAYCASKHGVIGMSKSIALESAGSGVTSNCICPGFALTPLVQKQYESNAKAQGITVDEAKHQFLFEKHPTIEFIQPENLGALAVFLCSEPAGQINGASLSMDLGWTAR